MYNVRERIKDMSNTIKIILGGIAMIVLVFMDIVSVNTALLFVAAPISFWIMGYIPNTIKIVFILIPTVVLGFTGVLPANIAWAGGALIILNCLFNRSKPDSGLHSELVMDVVNLDVTRVLLADGADVNALDRSGLTPLQVAAASNTNSSAIQLLLDAGADINARGKNGLTPLHDAAGMNTNTEIIQPLLNAGASINAQDKWGQTPLHLAAWHNKNPEIIIELLKFGANAKLKDIGGKTALDHANNRAKRNSTIRNSPAYQALKEACE